MAAIIISQTILFETLSTKPCLSHSNSVIVSLFPSNFPKHCAAGLRFYQVKQESTLYARIASVHDLTPCTSSAMRLNTIITPEIYFIQQPRISQFRPLASHYPLIRPMSLRFNSCCAMNDRFVLNCQFLHLFMKLAEIIIPLVSWLSWRRRWQNGGNVAVNQSFNTLSGFPFYA